MIRDKRHGNGAKVSIPPQIKSTWGKLEWSRAVRDSKSHRKEKLTGAVAVITQEISMLDSLILEFEKRIEDEEGDL